MSSVVNIEFEEGTLLLSGGEGLQIPFEQWCIYDNRVDCWRADASAYADIVKFLYRNKIVYEDNARKYETLNLRLNGDKSARDYQQEAIEAWCRQEKRGIIVLPTGTGKTFVAQLAIERVQRSTIIIVPTIDLMVQWTRQLEEAFNTKVAMFGGGAHEFASITVTTYDSALLTVDSHGGEFGLMIVDECHHLPGNTYRHIAKAAIAPYRLGLSATPERNDLGDDNQLEELLGNICYRKDIRDLTDNVLASYRTERLYVELSTEEFEAYHSNRDIYLTFIRRHGIPINTKQGWSQFLIAAYKHAGGREALRAFFTQKRIALSGRAKIEKIWDLLKQHRQNRIIIFTADNRTAYEIGERFRLPVLTHHTKPGERKDFLERFRTGEYMCLVTSKVLNEGVDVPEADVGIVVSGSGSIREHVQRLGRILRPSAAKTAVLYEIISFGTNEFSISDRRRQHSAYERSDN